MTVKCETYRVLIVSRGEKMEELFRDTFKGAQYRDITMASSMGEAKRLCVSSLFDIIVINTPLADEFGIQSAIDLSVQHSAGILLLVKSDIYEQAVSQAEPCGIIALQKPMSKQTLYMAVKMLSAVQMRIRRMEKEASRLKERMREQRTIDRAKWVLVDQRKMSEPDAHRYIERQAMDRSLKKIEIAEEILKDL